MSVLDELRELLGSDCDAISKSLYAAQLLAEGYEKEKTAEAMVDARNRLVSLRNHGEVLVEIAKAAKKYIADLDGLDGTAEDDDLRAALARLEAPPQEPEA